MGFDINHGLERLRTASEAIDAARGDAVELADIANRAYRDAERFTIEKFVEAGLALLAARETMDHGAWAPWLAERWTQSPRHARRAMQVAGHWIEHRAKRERSTLLECESVNEALRLIQKPKSRPDTVPNRTRVAVLDADFTVTPGAPAPAPAPPPRKLTDEEKEELDRKARAKATRELNALLLEEEFGPDPTTPPPKRSLTERVADFTARQIAAGACSPPPRSAPPAPSPSPAPLLPATAPQPLAGSLDDENCALCFEPIAQGEPFRFERDEAGEPLGVLHLSCARRVDASAAAAPEPLPRPGSLPGDPEICDECGGEHATPACPYRALEEENAEERELTEAELAAKQARFDAEFEAAMSPDIPARRDLALDPCNVEAISTLLWAGCQLRRNDTTLGSAAKADITHEQHVLALLEGAHVQVAYKVQAGHHPGSDCSGLAKTVLGRLEDAICAARENVRRREARRKAEAAKAAS